MDNRILKKRLAALSEQIDVNLINPDQYQALDLDLIVTQETTAFQLIGWFQDTIRLFNRTKKTILIMSQETYEIVRKLHDDDNQYLWEQRLVIYSTILGHPYIIKGKILEAQNES